MERLQGIQFGQLCPCCSSDRIDIADGIRECECGAIFTIKDDRMTLEQALKLVDFRTLENAEDDAEYFDFCIKYPDGNTQRIHGWYSPKTRRACQIG